MTGAVGASTALLFLVIFTLDGWLRPGYRPIYHPVSALALGRRGWLQTVNFLVCGGGMIIGAVGLWPEHRWLPAVLVVVGLALIASGVWAMDPMRGYPPGTPASTPSSFSWGHRLHDWAGAVLFISLPVAAVVAALSAAGPGLKAYSVFTAIIWALSAAAFAHAWEHDTRWTGGIQRICLWSGLVWVSIVFATT